MKQFFVAYISNVPSINILMRSSQCGTEKLWSMTY